MGRTPLLTASVSVVGSRPIAYPRERTHGQQQLVVAILLLGAIAGALVAGWLADLISRRRRKMIPGTVYVIGGLACALSRNYPEILASRFVLGLSVGTASFVSPMYIAELVPKRVEG